jgi:hypothetical protein
MASRVFTSYRRGDARYQASTICDRLGPSTLPSANTVWADPDARSYFVGFRFASPLG